MLNRNSGIKISLASSQLSEGGSAEVETPVSLWMYVAGLVVSLAGLYAVTYSMQDQNYAMILRILVTCGYATSYWMRRNNISLSQYRAPLLVLFVTILYFVASTSNTLTNTVLDTGASKSYNLQVIIVWIAVLQSFTLNSNAAILFACVPSLALIGIMGSSTPDDEVQDAFMVFIAAATFLMIHENFLRTRAAMQGKTAPKHDGRLFSSQLLLAGVCVVGAMMLAAVVASPMRMLGRAVTPSFMTGPQDGKNSSHNLTTTNVHVDEKDELDLGSGPVIESNQLILTVKPANGVPLDGLYWRGMTYDYYDGLRFVNHRPDPRIISPVVRCTRWLTEGEVYPDPDKDSAIYNTFDLKQYAFELGTGKMLGARKVAQTVAVMGGSVNQIYGAATFEQVITVASTLRLSDAGELSLDSSSIPMHSGVQYKVTSLVPDSRPETLRAAKAYVPDDIRKEYTQVAYDDKGANPRLQALANEMTVGKTTEYDKAIAIRDAIAQRCKYNLDAPAQPGGADSVEYFLDEEKQGYCNSFAAAMTILCRYAGIPARLASGFLAGDPRSDGSYEVREKHKHAWTEVYFTDIGWVPFDATYGAVDITPAADTAKAPGSPLLRWLTRHGTLPPILLGVILLLLSYVIKTELLPRLRRASVISGGYASLLPNNLAILARYAMACTLFARRGMPRAPGVTPNEFASHVQARFAGESQLGESMEALTRLHEKFCYGPGEALPEDIVLADTLLQSIRTGLRNVRVRDAI